MPSTPLPPYAERPAQAPTLLKRRTRPPRIVRCTQLFFTRWFRRFSATGLLVGTVLLAFSLTPSLVPRPMVLQGLVSGLSLSLGYLLGVAGQRVWRFLELPRPRARTHRAMLGVASVICFATAAGFLWRASDWQNAQRLLMGMPSVETVRPYSVALIALLVFLFAVVVARKFRRTARFLSTQLKRVVPRRIAYAVGAVLATALFWTVTQGLVWSAVLRAADSSYRQLDQLVPDDMERPTQSTKTGSPESLIDWRDLGRQGKTFVSTGPTAAEIETFHGAPAQEPIRVYVGLNSADTPQARAQLALEELIRVGGMDRSILLLVTPTGTGWVDPAALDPVEFLHRGDIASVAAQYSYLSSPLALASEAAYGEETARALFDAVYGYWSRLPSGSRPRLYLFGLSLGALNSDLSFHLHDILADPFHGALWAGPPFRSPTRADVTANRDPDSPEWLPQYRGGRVVRFANQNQGPAAVTAATWTPLRVLYLQYGSDPITFFSTGSAFREPAWMRAPRAPDVTPDLRWYPIVTMLQLAADMAAGADATPPGYGHNFAAEHYINAWRVLTEPEGWSDADVARLKDRFRQQRAP